MKHLIDPAAVHRILVIKPRAVGDVVLSTVVLRNLRHAFPETALDFLTEPPSRDIVAHNPDVDDVIIFDRKKMSGTALIREVRRRRYDLVLDLFGNPRTALVTRLSGARYRVGYQFRGRTYAYSIVVEPRGGQVHNTQFNLDALQTIGVPLVSRAPVVPIREEDDRYVASFFDGRFPAGTLVAGLNSGGGWYTKRWPLEKFAALGDALVEKHGAAIVLPWGPGQEGEVRTMASMMRSPAFIPPPTTLLQLAALLKRCSLVVSNDSGPMHIAAASGVPVLGIFGPTNPLLQGPFGPKNMTVRNEGLTCLGCNLTSCPIGNPCMKELTVDAVLAAVQQLLEMNALLHVR